MRSRASRFAALLVASAAVLLFGTGAAVAAGYPHEDPGDRATFDPYFVEQWALQRINAPAAWSKASGAGIRIGIVDTGIDLTHEDLSGKIAASTGCIGANDVQSACRGSAQDDQGHGTHVAGIAAAVTDNAKGVAGVAPGASLVVVKALGANGSGVLNDVNAGIKWAVDHGARVINLSLEADAQQVTVLPGQSLAEGVQYAWQHGAIPVIAAGNSTPSLFGSSGYSGINAVIVGATGRNNEVAWYSSPLDGAKWALVAPGGDARGPNGQASCAGALADSCIVSSGWFAGHANQYADDEGTSMAAPHVAGVLALLLSQGLSPNDAVNRLLDSAARIPCGGSCHGLVDAAVAVGAPLSAGTPATTVTTALRPQPTPTTSVVSPAIASGSPHAVSAPPPTTAPAPVTTSASSPRTTKVVIPAPPSPPPSPPPTRPIAVAPLRRHANHVNGLAVAAAFVALIVVSLEVVAGYRGRRSWSP